jgi:hypothetical protein
MSYSHVRQRNADDLRDSLVNKDKSGRYADLIEKQGGFERAVDTDTAWDVHLALRSLFLGRYKTEEYSEVYEALKAAREASAALSEAMWRASHARYKRNTE